MWKATTGHNVVATTSNDDDWDTDPDFVVRCSHWSCGRNNSFPFFFPLPFLSPTLYLSVFT